MIRLTLIAKRSSDCRIYYFRSSLLAAVFALIAGFRERYTDMTLEWLTKEELLAEIPL